jgi:Domain of unknown function (DUF3850)
MTSLAKMAEVCECGVVVKEGDPRHECEFGVIEFADPPPLPPSGVEDGITFTPMSSVPERVILGKMESGESVMMTNVPSMKLDDVAFEPTAKPDRPVWHELKVWTKFFKALLEDAKPYEYRKNDRDFHAGELLCLREWDQDSGYSGRYVWRIVSHILFNEPRVGLPEGYAVLGLSTPKNLQMWHGVQLPPGVDPARLTKYLPPGLYPQKVLQAMIFDASARFLKNRG